MGRHDLAGDEQAEPEPCTSVRVAEPLVRVEDRLEICRLDARPVVTDDDLRLQILDAYRDIDRGRLGRMLDGVDEKVHDHLLEAGGIGPDEDRSASARHLDRRCLWDHLGNVDRRLDDRREIDCLEFELHLARLDP